MILSITFAVMQAQMHNRFMPKQRQQRYKMAQKKGNWSLQSSRYTCTVMVATDRIITEPDSFNHIHEVAPLCTLT